MAITFSNPMSFTTAACSLLTSQSVASISFFFRYDGDPAAASGTILRKQYDHIISAYLHTVDANNVSIQFTLLGANGTATKTITFAVGTAYHVAMVWQSGAQTIYVNGVPTAMGTVAGTTGTDALYFQLGTGSGTSACKYTLSDMAIWHGYALTGGIAGDVAALRDGAAPSTVGGSATLRCEWTLAGPAASTAAIGNAGLKNSFGDTAYDFTGISGAGTGVYSDPLIVVPTVQAAATVLTSGQAVRFLFSTIGSGAVATPTTILATPTVSRNGVSLGPLINPYLTSIHYSVVFMIPAGQTIVPGDVVTVDAPAGWMVTGAGIVSALSGTAANNCAGKSAFGTDALAKTLKPGMCFSWSPNSYAPYWLLKNIRHRQPKFAGTVNAADGAPLSGTPGVPQPVAYSTQASGLRAGDRSPMPPGLYAVGWDDPSYSLSITTSTGSNTAATTITERTDLANPGSGGVGQVRVFDVKRTAGSTTGGIDVWIKMTNSGGAISSPYYTIHGPGAFSYTPGVPVVLDKSDPYAFDPSLTSRLPNGVGTVRTHDGTWYGGTGLRICELADIRRISDWSWDVSSTRYTIAYTQIAAWNPATHGYVYSDLFGTPFTATLGTGINSAVTTLNITDAATAPVIIGLKLQVDSELMRVVDVSGTTVTVTRAIDGTTAASHSAGSISVLNRQSVALDLSHFLNNSLVPELTTQAPHRLRTGQYITLGGSASDWNGSGTGTVFTNGYVKNFSGTLAAVFVTGPNTFIFTWFMNALTNGPVTVNGTQSLNPANCTTPMVFPEGYMPVEVLPRLATKLGANCHVNIPNCASNDLIDWIARMVRDGTTPGKKVYVEYSNEPWNNTFSSWTLVTFVQKWVYPGASSSLAWYAARSSQIWQRFRDRFNEVGGRGGEIIGLVNTQYGDPSNGSDLLTWAGQNGVSIGAYAIAPYIDVAQNVANNTAFWAATDEQAIDLFLNDIHYNTSTAGDAVANLMAIHAAAVASYNSTYSQACILYAYEYGPEMVMPPYSTTTDGTTGALTASSGDTTIHLAANASATTANLYVGQYLFITSSGWPYQVLGNNDEWVQVATIVDSYTLTVTRGVLGTSPIAHAAGSGLRSAYLERHRDMIFNPNWRVAEQDIFALAQTSGFKEFDPLGYSFPWPSGYGWGVWNWPLQVSGKGDGSDGLADNRTHLAMPGQPNTITSTQNQDLLNVSVRGQAMKEWMAQAAPPLPPPPSGTSSRRSHRLVFRPRF